MESRYPYPRTRACPFGIYYTADGGESWDVIIESAEGMSHSWIIPDVASDNCLVLVEAYDGEGIMGYDMSDQSFTVCAGAGIPREEAVPTSFALYPASPNPFTGGTAVRFDLPYSRHVKLTIHDVRGRLVQELIDEVRPAKSYSDQWDGKDSFAVEVPAGIYFVHLEAGDYKATSKIVLVR